MSGSALLNNRVRIIATVGPASQDVSALRRIIREGATVLRLNFSHGSLPIHEESIRRIRRIEKELGRHIAVLQDLPGPKIRTGAVRGGQPVEVQPGATLTITTRRVLGQPGLISTNYAHLANDVKRGHKILIDDGRIELRVLSTAHGDVRCEVVFGGEIGEHKGINLPGVKLTARSPTRNDLAFARFGVERGVDYIALSFVRSASEVQVASRYLRKLKADVPIIAKIEKPEALEDLDGILDAADGVMVARGDLAVETSSEDVPIYQKRIIATAREKGKLAITATQMLDSMMHAPTPTRAEASDIANAVLDGSDALMLSGETAVGKFPVESVRTMSTIIAKVEDSLADRAGIPCTYDPSGHVDFTEAAAHSACAAARDLSAKAVVVYTWSGRTALTVANYRPNVPIIALSARSESLRRVGLYWGVIPVRIKPFKSVQRLLEGGEEALLRERLVQKGDVVVVLVGSTLLSGTTNMMKIHRVGSGTK